VKVAFRLIFLFFIYNLDLKSQLKLSDQSVNSFFFKKNDCLWISTEKGWNKYDGINTVDYQLENKNSGLKGTFIQSTMYPDNEGRLWTCTYEYLCYFDSQKNKFTSIQPIVNGDTLNIDFKIIGFDLTKENLYYRAKDYLFKHSLKNNTHSKISDEKTNGITFFSLLDKKEGNDLIITCPWLIDNSIEIWEKNKIWQKTLIDFKQCKNLLKKTIVSQAYFYNETIYLATNIGLLKLDRYHPCNSELFNPPGIFLTTSHFIERNNKLYITSESDGLWILDLFKQKFIQNYTVSNSDETLKSNSPVEIFSSEGDLILSFRNQGIQTIPFYQLENKINLSTTITPSKIDFLSTANNKLLFAEDGKGIWVLNPDYTLFDFIPLNSNLRLIDLKSIDEQSFYYCDYFNLYKYDFKAKKVQLLVRDLSIQISKIVNYQCKLAIIGNANLYEIDSINNRYSKIANDKTENQVYYSIQLGIDTSITFYGSTNAVLNAKADSTYLNFGSYTLSHAYDKNKNVLYIGAINGLYTLSLKDKKITKIKAWQIDQKKIKNLFINQGSLYIEADNDYYILEQGNEIKKLSFGTNSFEINKKAIFLDDKIIWSENNKLYYKNKNEILSPSKNKIVLEKAGYAFNYKDKLYSIKYGWKDKPPHLHFTYNDVEENELGFIRYQIVGVDNEFKLLKVTDSLAMPFLPEGKYKINIIGLNRDETDANKESIIISVIGPIWRQWWFYVLTVFPLFGLLYWYFDSKTKRLEEIHGMNQEINALEKSALQAQMNPHFIFNCLNSIQSYIAQNEKLLAMDYLGKFAKLIRQYLQASVSGSIPLDQEISMLTSYCELETLRFSSRFKYSITHDDSINTSAIFLPSMLIQPFVENAIIHGMKGSADGMIKIHFLIEALSLKVTITDNGKGFDQAGYKNKNSLGMSITQKRLQHIKSNAGVDYNVVINSGPEGTVIYLKIPIEIN
jgi:hypothetical protein